MANTAAQIQYRQEYIAAAENRVSLLRNFVTTEAVIKGNQAVFLVAGSGNANAVTRGVNGLIPQLSNSLTQNTATLVEWHAPFETTGFNIFQSQGDLRRIMQENSIAVMNRRADADIMAILATGTQTTGSAATADLKLAVKAKTIIGNAKFPNDGNIFAAITPAFEAYLMQTREFGSREYVDFSAFAGMSGYNAKPQSYRWAGVTWTVHPDLPGVGTSSESCFMWHKSAVGHAINTGGIQATMGYDEKQDMSWTRASGFMGGVLLQNAGVVKMVHDGSAYVAS